MFLNGNFVALPAFQKHFGYYLNDKDGWVIATRWQSALFQAGQCGAFVGVFLAGPITNRFGYRWTTIMALMLMNATIFVSFFVSTDFIQPILVACADFLGRFSRSSRRRTGSRRCSLGFLHCQRSRLRQ